MGTDLAYLHDALPSVADAADRALRFPTPRLGQLAYRIDGAAMERWDGASWVALPIGGGSVLATGATVARTLQSRFADAPGIDEFGGDKTGVADSSAAVALAIANGFRTLRVNGSYKMAPAAAIELPFGFNFVGDGTYGVSTLVKATTGNVFSVKAYGVGFRNLSFDADVATNPAFGTTGVMVDYPTGFSSAEGRLIDVTSHNVDQVIRFGADAGARHQVIGGFMLPYTTTVGSEGMVYASGVDTAPMYRQIHALKADGRIDLRGAIIPELVGVECRAVLTDAATSLFNMLGGVMALGGGAVTIDGSGTRIKDVRFAGDVTLAATMSGSCVFVGNNQTAGTFDDNSPPGVCLTFHQPLSSGWTALNKFTLSHSVNPEEILSNRVSTNVGDADVTITADQSPKTFRLSSVLTAARVATLPLAGRDGVRYRFVRQAGATGAFDWLIKSNAGVTIGTLATEKTWLEVDWDGPGAAFILTAQGTLP